MTKTEAAIWFAIWLDWHFVDENVPILLYPAQVGGKQLHSASNF